MMGERTVVLEACSATLTGPFAGRVFRRRFPWLEEELWHKNSEVHGRAESVRHQAGRGRHASGGDLPHDWDQPGDLLQLEEEIRWTVAV